MRSVIFNQLNFDSHTQASKMENGKTVLDPRVEYLSSRPISVGDFSKKKKTPLASVQL